MMKYFLIILFGLIQPHAKGQYTARVGRTDNAKFSALNVSGVVRQPLQLSKYAKVIEGSAYYPEEWKKAILFVNDDIKVKDILLRIDFITNELNYHDDEQGEMIILPPYQRVVFVNNTGDYETTFIHGSQLPVTDRKLLDAWFQEIVLDNKFVYKCIRKSIIDVSRSYTSTAAEQRIETEEKLHVFKEGKLVRWRN